MSIENKTFQELDLCNSFLFAAALERPEICRLVLEIILGQKMPKVKVHSGHSVLVSSNFQNNRFRALYLGGKARAGYVCREVSCVHREQYDYPVLGKIIDTAKGKLPKRQEKQF